MKKAILITSTNSNSGKTLICCGLCRYLYESGFNISPFKCGPDYIDTSLLGRSAKTDAYNLDSIFMSRSRLKTIFFNRLLKSDIGVVEGVMGYFDGINANFNGSTYEIANILKIPTVFILNVGASAQSILIPLKGIESLVKSVNLIGIILNNITSELQKSLIVNALKRHSKIKILGIIPKLGIPLFESRHLGLKTAKEINEDVFNEASNIINKYVYIDKIIKMADIKIKYSCKNFYIKRLKTKKHVYIPFDEAFNFYYSSNFKYLEELGYEIHFFSPIENEGVKDCDLLYIGGGYPELHAKKLQNNNITMESIINHHRKKRNIIAECGGLIYLSHTISRNEEKFNMCNIFNIDIEMQKNRQALGYVDVELLVDLMGVKKGKKTKGHVFHYSSIIHSNENYVLKLSKLSTGEKMYDGFFKDNSFASYTHFHFLSKNNILKGLIE